jgi:aminoglycoside phosphotransferase (APT) family kinase protein
VGQFGQKICYPQLLMLPEVAPIRAGEEIDVRALSDYLRGKMEGAERSVSIEQFPGGHSNLTYLVRAGGSEYVLRRPPLGPVAPKAHDMAREFRVLEAVHPVFPPAPRVFLLCEDTAVAGATFFLMERRHGVVLRRDVPPDFARDPEFPGKTSEAFIDCLAQLHSIDIESLGLASLGHPEGFLDRQVRGWTERWQRAKTEEMPGMDTLVRWLADRLPESPKPTLVHNDFKLDNIMWRANDAGRVEAVLDWEMATVGDPLVDLGCTLCYWTQAGDPELRGGALSGITAGPGWMTRAALVGRYAEKAGRDVSRLGYYEVFGLFKLGVILQQIYFRYHRGQTQDERFRDFYLRVRGLMRAAMELAEQLG